MHNILSLVLGGGRGQRLYPLTKFRSEPAVPIAGKYRLIDIPISNCINSGLNRIYVLTQFLSASLHRHLANTYKFDPFSRGFVEVLAAQQTNETAEWYEGTADAVRQNVRYVQEDGGEDVLVLSGDQLYRMDFRRLVQAHRQSKADVTVAVVPVPRGRTRDLGVVRVDDALRITRLVEKPQTDAELGPLRTSPEWLEQHGVGAAHGREHLANMGIYLFRRGALLDLLGANPGPDFVRDLLAPNLNRIRIQAFVFDGYWDDLGTIKSYFEANLALAGDAPPFDFHTPDGVMYTRMRNLPAARVQAARLEDALVSDGCLVASGADLCRCVLGVRSRIGCGVLLRDVVMLGADRYENESDREGNRRRGVPDFGVGDGTVIERAILDRDCRVGRDVKLVNRRGVQQEDGASYVIRDGIIIVPHGAVVADGSAI